MSLFDKAKEFVAEVEAKVVEVAHEIKDGITNLIDGGKQEVETVSKEADAALDVVAPGSEADKAVDAVVAEAAPAPTTASAETQSTTTAPVEAAPAVEESASVEAAPVAEAAPAPATDAPAAQ